MDRSSPLVSRVLPLLVLAKRSDAGKDLEIVVLTHDLHKPAWQISPFVQFDPTGVVFRVIWTFRLSVLIVAPMAPHIGLAGGSIHGRRRRKPIALVPEDNTSVAAPGAE